MEHVACVVLCTACSVRTTALFPGVGGQWGALHCFSMFSMFFFQVLDAVDWMHWRLAARTGTYVVHRDLSPLNMSVSWPTETPHSPEAQGQQGQGQGKHHPTNGRAHRVSSSGSVGGGGGARQRAVVGGSEGGGSGGSTEGEQQANCGGGGGRALPHVKIYDFGLSVVGF